MRVNRSLPKHIQAAQAFGPMYRLLKDIEKGEVEETSNGTIVLSNWAIGNGKIEHANAALSVAIWCETWNKIAQESGLEIPTNALLKFALELEKGEEFYQSTLKNAKAELDLQFKLWGKIDPKVINRACSVVRDSEPVRG